MKRRIALLLSLLSAALDAVAPAPAAAPVAFTTERMRNELGRLLANHFNLEGELEIELLHTWAPPARSAAIWQLEVLEFPAFATPMMAVRCRLVADGVVADQPNLTIRASLWRDVWFARQPVTAGTTFSPASLDTQRIDCFRVHDALPASAGDRSYNFARDIPPDRMLTWHDLVRRPLVRKGDLVEATAREGLLSVTMKALALENGARGDIINLRNPESHKEISAQVVDDGHVEIRF